MAASAISEAIRQGLERRGVRVLLRPWTNESKADALRHVRRHLYAGLLSLPPHSELVAELTNLEVRALASGRSRIAAAGGGRDDFATACMALVAELARAPSGGIGVVGVIRSAGHGSEDSVASARHVRARWRKALARREIATYRDPRGE